MEWPGMCRPARQDIEKGETMTTEKYQGWANRETWALNLWLSNDEGLYNMTREHVSERLDDPEVVATFNDYPDAAEDLARWRVTTAGEAVKALWDSITEGDSYRSGVCEISTESLAMLREVGSVWRVDWDEIGAAWLDGVDES